MDQGPYRLISLMSWSYAHKHTRHKMAENKALVPQKSSAQHKPKVNILFMPDGRNGLNLFVLKWFICPEHNSRIWPVRNTPGYNYIITVLRETCSRHSFSPNSKHWLYNDDILPPTNNAMVLRTWSSDSSKFVTDTSDCIRCFFYNCPHCSCRHK